MEANWKFQILLLLLCSATAFFVSLYFFFFVSPIQNLVLIVQILQSHTNLANRLSIKIDGKFVNNKC